MPTKNPRLNITLKPTTAALLTSIAKQKRQSVASLAKAFVLEALERREDKALSVLAERRDSKKVKCVKHDHAWV